MNQNINLTNKGEKKHFRPIIALVNG